MTPELIAIVTVGVALAGVIFTSMARLESRLDRRIAALESRLNGKIDALSVQLGELRERMARLEGLMDGLRESIVDRARAS